MLICERGLLIHYYIIAVTRILFIDGVFLYIMFLRLGLIQWSCISCPCLATHYNQCIARILKCHLGSHSYLSISVHWNSLGIGRNTKNLLTPPNKSLRTCIPLNNCWMIGSIDTVGYCSYYIQHLGGNSGVLVPIERQFTGGGDTGSRSRLPMHHVIRGLWPNSVRNSGRLPYWRLRGALGIIETSLNVSCDIWLLLNSVMRLRMFISQFETKTF